MAIPFFSIDLKTRDFFSIIKNIVLPFNKYKLENKLKHKKLDLIVANDVSDKSIGFDSEENEVTLITNKEKQLLKKQNKKRISKKIIEFISGRINEQNN